MKIPLAVLFVFATTTILTASSYFLNNVNASDSVVTMGGNGSSWDAITPKNTEIKAGDTVTWRNPMVVSEPHTVSFLKNQSYYPPPAMPVPLGLNSTDLKSDPDANFDPLVITAQNGTKSVIVDNAQHYNPVTVSSGYNVTYLPINANYTLTGTEKFVSSGWMWPDGLAPKGAPPIKSFSVTFEKPGTYDYICIIHPWMNGVVTVM